MMTVLGLSLLSCPHCEAAFPTVPTLNHHIEQEHSQGSTISTTAIADSYLSTSWTQSKTSSVTTPSVSCFIYLNIFFINFCFIIYLLYFLYLLIIITTKLAVDLFFINFCLIVHFIVIINNNFTAQACNKLCYFILY